MTVVDIEKLAEKAKAQLPKKAEPKGAAPAPSAETKKTEEEVKKAAPDAEAAKKVAEAKSLEEKAKHDESILAKDEKDLNESEKVRKAELVKSKQDAEDKERKSNVQKRFDELTSTIKSMKDEGSKDKATIASLQSELDGIKKQLSMTPQDKLNERVESSMAERRKKALEEDKSLPREKRREMSKDELDQWALEDYEGANEWIAKRTLRRYEEERSFRHDVELSEKAEVILAKQQASAERTFEKHPELRDLPAKRAELVRQGKTDKEVAKILGDSNPKYKAVLEIYLENPDKYTLSENAPELIVEEMEKRLNISSSGKPSDVEELKAKLAALEAENAKLKGLDSTITSTRRPEPSNPPTDFEKKMVEVAGKAGLSPERIKAAAKRRVDLGYDG